ncbi:hypothetical protein GWI33_015072 [Rhynchophorus ferrugineus]|uniref:Uncharacterized protein n=1 Tax=Rhynchophorus ferrugineus TaxID=354439 RepID=A0A834I3Z9_RHYFE|nr:hypothetical protein GWI33_015072 [Rhynchophorus ferrugineus]
MLGFNFFGSMSKLNLIGRDRHQNQRGQTSIKIKQFTSYSDDVREPSEHPEPAQDTNSDKTKEEQVEARDTFEIHETKFYRVMTKSFYDANMDMLRPYQKNESPSVPRRARKLTKKLSERKMVISSPSNFKRVEDNFTMSIRQRMVLDRQSTIKKSLSMDNLLMDRDDDALLDAPLSDHKSASLRNLAFVDDDDDDSVETPVTLAEADFPSRISSECGSESDSSEPSIEEDIDKAVEEYNLVQMRHMSKSLVSFLVSVFM